MTSREIATAIIVIGLLSLSLLNRKSRTPLLQSALKVANSLTNWRICVVLLGYLLYLLGMIVAAHTLGAWSGNLLKETLIVGFWVGLPFIFNSSTVQDGIEITKNIAKQVLGIGALLVAYLNLVTFPLWGEIILQLFLLYSTILMIVSKSDPKKAPVVKIFTSVTALIAIGLIIHVAVHLMIHSDEIDWQHEASVFALSVWVPLALIPLAYLLGLIASSSKALGLARFRNDQKRLPPGIRTGFFIGTRGSLRYTSAFVKDWLPKLAAQTSVRSTLQLMRKYRQVVDSNARWNSRRRRRLRKNAGAARIDQNGLWLDRREFYETKKALEYLSDSLGAMKRTRGGRYRIDLAPIDRMSDYGLPGDHRVKLCEREDGQAWAAWRKTVGGFYLGAGGTIDLDACWRYAGPGAPSNFPHSDIPGWTNAVTGKEVCNEWDTDDGPVPLS